MPSRPIPSPRFIRYANKRIKGQMTYQVAIFRPSPAGFNNSSGIYTAHATTRGYAGPARIYQVSGPQVEQIGDQVLALRQTMISIPASAAPVPRRNDVLTVIASDDGELTGKWFRILDVTLGGLGNPIRSLTVVNEEPTQWTEA